MYEVALGWLPHALQPPVGVSVRRCKSTSRANNNQWKAYKDDSVQSSGMNLQDNHIATLGHIMHCHRLVYDTSMSTQIPAPQGQ